MKRTLAEYKARFDKFDTSKEGRDWWAQHGATMRDDLTMLEFEKAEEFHRVVVNGLSAQGV